MPAAFVFIHIARTDSAAGGADLLAAQHRFAGAVQRAVPRHHDMCARVNFQLIAGNAACFQSVNFSRKSFGSSTTPQPIRQSVPGYKYRTERGAVYTFRRRSRRCDRIVAPLRTNDYIRTRSQNIDGFAFAFIAPLTATTTFAGILQNSFTKFLIYFPLLWRKRTAYIIAKGE